MPDEHTITETLMTELPYDYWVWLAFGREIKEKKTVQNEIEEMITQFSVEQV